MKNPSKNYWLNRDVTKRLSLEILKNIPLLAWIFSCRSADAFYIKNLLLSYQNSVVLDVGCGSGKKQLVQFSTRAYGVDIPGFPIEQALRKGYKSVQEWEKPDYLINLPENVDIIFVISVNAHVEWNLLEVMLTNAVKNAKNNSMLIFINEYDNNSLMYRIMKKSPIKFKDYVNGMEHWHLEYESSFIKKVSTQFPNWKYLRREELVRNPPFSHFLAFNRKLNKLKFVKASCLFMDVFISFYNNILKTISNSEPDNSFLVAHLYRINSE